MLFQLTLLPLISFTPINEVNPDYKVVPTRSEWNETCMATELKENGYDNRLNNGKVWGSSIDKGFAQSKCTCRHEHVKDLGVMNFMILFPQIKNVEKNLLRIIFKLLPNI